MSEVRSSEALHTPALSSGWLALEKPCREGAQAALWSGRVVRPAPAPTLQHTSECPRTGILQPQSSLQRTAAPTCEQSQTQTPVSYRRSDPLKPSEVTKDCFKPLSLGIAVIQPQWLEEPTHDVTSTTASRGVFHTGICSPRRDIGNFCFGWDKEPQTGRLGLT